LATCSTFGGTSAAGFCFLSDHRCESNYLFQAQQPISLPAQSRRAGHQKRGQSGEIPEKLCAKLSANPARKNFFSSYVMIVARRVLLVGCDIQMNNEKP
jgi:hypothetical protein